MNVVRQFEGLELPSSEDSKMGRDHQLLLLFGGAERLQEPAVRRALQDWTAVAVVAGASSAVTIHNSGANCDGGVVCTLLRFEHTPMKMAAEPIATASDSYDTGIRMGEALVSEDLAYVLLLADGVRVNGSALARGVQEAIGSAVLVTGGLANDGTAFRSTFVVAGEQVLPNHAVAVGFYGNRLRVGHAAIGGWQPFGPYMVVTKVDGNTVYEFDGAPALSIYERYLGPEADELPAAGLYFPIAVYDDWGQPVGLVRTLLGIDRERGSLIFAGEVPGGSRVRLMHVRCDELVDAAGQAATRALDSFHEVTPSFGLLISCIGRYLLMGEFVSEEVDAARNQLGDRPHLTGFYSNGELSPLNPEAKCQLHNQTMTITLWAES